MRSAEPVKINEVRFASGGNATDQFVELYNASPRAVDISRWKLTNTRTFFASVPLATIPARTTLKPHGFYLLGLASSGLTAPAAAGATSINVRSIAGFAPGQQVVIDGESRTVKSVGTAATLPTTVFIPVSTGPWLIVPAGSTNIPVANATGFTVGQKVGLDAGGHFEIATVTAVGKAATQTVLAVAAMAGTTNIKLADVSAIAVGDTLSVGTGQRLEWVKVMAVGTPGADGTGVTLAAPLRFDTMLGADVAGRGTGISFTPATRFAHTSGDAVEALGSGITLDRPLARSHAYGAPVVNPQVRTDGYQGPAPNQWFGGNLSIRGGSIALADPGGKVLVDAIVYGSQQGNSSASGAITSPEIATLEGVQHQGGCIAVIPGAGSGPSAPATALAASAPGAPDRSIGRFPDGADTDSLCDDFRVQPATVIPQGSAAGATSIKVASVADFVPGETIALGAAGVRESAVIAAIGTSGATVSSAASEQGGRIIPVAAAAGFSVGQTITIGEGADAEDAAVSLIQGGRGGARITVTEPLGRPHAAGTHISGSGITLTAPLTRDHAVGAPVTAELPTPGAANLYAQGKRRR